MVEQSPRPPSLSGIAVKSSRAELHPGWAWGLTLVVVLAGGVTLHAARSVLGSALDRWVPERQRPAAAASSEEMPRVAPEPERAAGEPAEPEWTFVDIEAAIQPLPASTGTLIEEGRSELPQFQGMAAAEETRALVIRNRWGLWGRVWRNRVDQLRRPLPPATACDVHAALEPTCRALRESLGLLDRIPAAGSVEDAGALLDQAAAVLEELNRPPEEDITAEDSVAP